MSYTKNGFVVVNKKPTRLNDQSQYIVNNNITDAFFQKKNTDVYNNFITAILLGGFVFLSSMIPFGASASNGNGMNINYNGMSFKVKLEEIKKNSATPFLNGESIFDISDDIRIKLGLKTAQWANLLRVERKTIYNWKKNPNVRVRSETYDRIQILDAFAGEFRFEHKKYFSKMLFGRNFERDLLAEFIKPKLELAKLLAAYDKVYAQLDGYATRADLFG